MELKNMKSDIHIFSIENLSQQVAEAEEKLGYKVVTFYTDDKDVPSKIATHQKAKFYFAPSGGTLRDKDFNIVQYVARLDLYKGMGKT